MLHIVVGWLNISPDDDDSRLISVRREVHGRTNFWNGKTLTSIRVQDLVIIVTSAPSREQQYRGGHVGLVSRAAGHVGHGHLFQLGFPIGSRRARRHLGREDSRCHHVDADARLGEGRGEHAAQVQKGGFRSGVGYVAVGGVFEEGGVAARVDDAGCISRRDAVAFGEERQERDGHEEPARAVGLECCGPMLRFRFHKVRGDGQGVAEIGLAGSVETGGVVTGDAGVVDEELDAIGLRGGDRLCESLDRDLFADICGEATDTGIFR